MYVSKTILENISCKAWGLKTLSQGVDTIFLRPPRSWLHHSLWLIAINMGAEVWQLFFCHRYRHLPHSHTLYYSSQRDLTFGAHCCRAKKMQSFAKKIDPTITITQARLQRAIGQSDAVNRVRFLYISRAQVI